MNAKIINSNFFRITGLLGMFGMLIGVMADIFTGFSAKGGLAVTNVYSLSFENFYELFRYKPHWELVTGHYLAVAGIPLGMFGLWQVYQAIKPAGPWLSLPGFLMGIYGYTVGTVFHGVFAFMAAGFQAKEASSDSVLIEMMNRFQDLFAPLSVIFLVPIFAASIYIFIAIASGRTLYPRWMIFINPIFIQILAGLLASIVPPPLRTLLVITAFNLSLFIVYTISTVVLWNYKLPRG